MRIGSVAGKNVSTTGLRELLSNLRVPKDNPKSSFQRSNMAFVVPFQDSRKKLNAANKGHTQVKERGNCSGFFTIASESY
ncbi:hypothetical protein Riv7116_3261 [Rivularia sp. PCC 7116]|uniref:hypothetical protein n=1 Tax=Rivularia sp. PCC 7116 TaxID=373994 RepID=UPI00029ED43D|nr:hypothetical protein [Rivularia sp. PCC 7116]AFY55728.1 hypothetical protein Riv7116_3261 [Rivularia sp. PCC 7116]